MEVWWVRNGEGRGGIKMSRLGKDSESSIPSSRLGERTGEKKPLVRGRNTASGRGGCGVGVVRWESELRENLRKMAFAHVKVSGSYRLNTRRELAPTKLGCKSRKNIKRCQCRWVRLPERTF